jgi:hypothetical protein
MLNHKLARHKIQPGVDRSSTTSSGNLLGRIPDRPHKDQLWGKCDTRCRDKDSEAHHWRVCWELMVCCGVVRPPSHPGGKGGVGHTM